jgi:hypothetical protein
MEEFIITPKNISSSFELPLELTGMGLNHIQERIIRPNGISSFQWIQCTKGQGVLLFNNSLYPVMPGWGIFIPPDISHEYYSSSKDWTVNYLSFSGILAKELTASLNLTNPEFFLFPIRKK